MTDYSAAACERVSASAASAPRFQRRSRGGLHELVELLIGHLFALRACANAHPAIGTARLVELACPVFDVASGIHQEINNPGVLLLLAVQPAHVARRGTKVADVLHDLVAARETFAADQLAEIRMMIHHFGVGLAYGAFEMIVVDAGCDLVADRA